MAFDIEQALKDGLTEDQISDYLSKTRKFNRDNALKTGYTHREVIDFLSSRDRIIDAPMPTLPKVSVEEPQGMGVLPALKEATKLTAETFTYPITKGAEFIKSVIPSKKERPEAGVSEIAPILPPGLLAPKLPEFGRAKTIKTLPREPGKPAIIQPEETQKQLTLPIEKTKLPQKKISQIRPPFTARYPYLSATPSVLLNLPREVVKEVPFGKYFAGEEPTGTTTDPEKLKEIEKDLLSEVKEPNILGIPFKVPKELKGEFFPTGTTTDPEKLKEIEKELATGEKRISPYESLAGETMSALEWAAFPTAMGTAGAIAKEVLPARLVRFFTTPIGAWLKSLTNKERQVVVQSLDDMLNRGYSEAEVLRRWNNPSWREEALKRRNKGEEYPDFSEAGRPKETPPTGPGPTVGPTEPLKPGPPGPPEPVGSTIPVGIKPVIEVPPTIQKATPPVEVEEPEMPLAMAPEPTIAPPGLQLPEPGPPPISPEETRVFEEVRALNENTDRLIREGGYLKAKKQPRSEKGEAHLRKLGYKPMIWDPETDQLIEHPSGEWVKAPEPPTEEIKVPPTAQHLEEMPEEYPEIDRPAVMQNGIVYTDHSHPDIVVSNNLDPEKAQRGYITKEGDFVPAEKVEGKEKAETIPRGYFPAEEWWDKTPGDREEVWQELYSYSESLKTQVEPEIKKLQGELKATKGPGSQQIRKEIKDRIDELEASYELPITEAENNMVDAALRHKEEAEALASGAGLSGDDLENFLIDYDMAISNTREYAEFYGGKTNREIFKDLLYREYGDKLPTEVEKKPMEEVSTKKEDFIQELVKKESEEAAKHPEEVMPILGKKLSELKPEEIPPILPPEKGKVSKEPMPVSEKGVKKPISDLKALGYDDKQIERMKYEVADEIVDTQTPSSDVSITQDGDVVRVIKGEKEVPIFEEPAIIEPVTAKKGKGTPTVEIPKPEGGIELVSQQETKKFVGDKGNEYVGTDASESLSSLPDQRFNEITGVSKDDFFRQGGSLYFIPANESIANSIHHISGEIVLSDTLKKNPTELRSALIHELTHWGQIQRSETPKAYYVDPAESIREYMEYLSDPAEVKARFNAEGRSTKEYEDFMGKLNWAKSEETGKLQPFEVGEIRVESQKRWKMPLSYLKKEIEIANRKGDKDYLGWKNDKQLKDNVAELEGVLEPTRTGKELIRKEDIENKLATIEERVPKSDEDVSNMNLLYLDIKRKWNMRRLFGSDRRLRGDEIEYLKTSVMRMEVLGKVNPKTGKRGNINPIIIEDVLRKRAGIKGMAVGPNEIDIDLTESNLKALTKVQKVINKSLPKPPTPAGKVGEVSIGDWSKGQSRPFAFDPNSTENEGRFRLYPPEEIEKGTYKSQTSIKSMEIEAIEGVRFLLGDTKDGDRVVQTIRFDKSIMPEEKARKWWIENAEKFGKEAVEESKQSIEKIVEPESEPLSPEIKTKIKETYVHPEEVKVRAITPEDLPPEFKLSTSTTIKELKDLKNLRIENYYGTDILRGEGKPEWSDQGEVTYTYDAKTGNKLGDYDLEKIKQRVEAKREYEKRLQEIEKLPDVEPKIVEPKIKGKIETPKEQKRYLIDAIDEAIKEAPEKYIKPVTIQIPGGEGIKPIMEKTPHVLIEVPGDGIFRVINSKEALEGFKTAVEHRFPGTIEKLGPKKGGSLSEKPSGLRISPKDEAGYEYISEYKPRRVIDADYAVEKTALISEGWFTNGQYAVKGEPPPGFGKKVERKGLTKEQIDNVTPNLKDMTKATHVAEFHFMDSGQNGGIAISNKNYAYFDPPLMDVVRKHHPDAELYIKDPESPMTFIKDGEVVGVLMPIRGNDPETLNLISDYLEGEKVKVPWNKEVMKEEVLEAKSEIGKVIQEEKSEIEVEKVSSQIATKLRTSAESLTKQIQEKRNPAVAQQNVTPRRARQTTSAYEEANRLENLQNKLNALADVHEADNVPASLEKVVTKSQVESILNRHQFPRAYLHKAWIDDILNATKGKPGTAKDREILLRVKIREENGGTLYGNEEISAAENLIKIGEKAGNKFPWAKENIAEHKRMLAIGIDTEEKFIRAKNDLNEIGKKPIDRSKEQKIRTAEQNLLGRKIPGYFPTPKATAEKLVEMADIEPEMSVLEPSAGKGNIADVIKEKIPGADLKTIEWQRELADILKLKGYEVVGSDFFKHDDKYDRIVMNPPFEKLEDIDHIRHAYEHLNPGGRLVSIMSESPFFRNDKKAVEFREWLDSIGGTSEKLPEKSFAKKSERATGIASRIVVINKPTHNIKFSKHGKKGVFNESEIQIIGSTKEAKRLQADLEISWGETFPKGTIIEVNLLQDGPTLRRIGSAFGKKVVFVDAKEGIKLPFGGSIIIEEPSTIYINVKSDAPHLHSLGHELTHTLKIETPDLYKKLRDRTDDLIQNFDAYQAFLDVRSAANKLPTEIGEAAKEEFYGDFVGEQFLNKDFWKKLHDREPNLFKKVVKIAKELLDRAVDWLRGQVSIGNTYFKDFRRAQDILANIMKEYAVKSRMKNRGIASSKNYNLSMAIPLILPFLMGKGEEEKKKGSLVAPSYLPPGLGR